MLRLTTNLKVSSAPISQEAPAPVQQTANEATPRDRTPVDTSIYSADILDINVGEPQSEWRLKLEIARLQRKNDFLTRKVNHLTDENAEVLATVYRLLDTQKLVLLGEEAPPSAPAPAPVPAPVAAAYPTVETEAALRRMHEHRIEVQLRQAEDTARMNAWYATVHQDFAKINNDFAQKFR